MIFTRKYGLFSYTVFRPWLKYLAPYFVQLRGVMQKGGMKVSLDEYMASFIMTVLLVGLGTAGIVLAYTLTFLKADIILLFMMEVVTLGIIVAGLFMFYLAYPEYKVTELKGELDKHVAFASTHLATIAGTGVPPHVMFQMLGDFKEYGQVAKTCQEISRNIAVFGYDTNTAISEEAKRTPSHKFKDLLWSIVASIRTGGDMRTMLINKSKALMEDQRRVEAKYIESLSMMAEIYSTVFVAGIVMIFVLVAIMGVLGGLPVPVKLVLQVTTYVGVPLASIGFIMLVESSKPTGA